jgi:hypothetical protein
VCDRGTSGLFFTSLVKQQTNVREAEPGSLLPDPLQKEWDAWKDKTHPRNLPPRPATQTETEFRHRGWHVRRLRVLRALANVPRAGKRRQRLRSCGSGCSVQISLDGSAVRLIGRFCGDRFCEPCARARARIVKQNLVEMFKGSIPLFITLTLMRSGGTVGQILNRLKKALRKLRQSALWKSAIKGGVQVYEITRGKNRDHWHVHTHILALGSYLPQKELSEAWAEASGGSFIVHVRRVGNERNEIGYTAEYATKGFDSTCMEKVCWIRHLMLNLRGRRLLTTFGCFRGRRLEANNSNSIEWRDCGSLDSIIDSAIRGNAFARGLVQALNVRIVRWHDRVVFESVSQVDTHVESS